MLLLLITASILYQFFDVGKSETFVIHEQPKGRQNATQMQGISVLPYPQNRY